MKIILKSLSVFILFVYMLLIFLPKENLYYLALEKLSAYKIELTNTKVQDKYVSLALENTNIKYEKIKVGSIDNIEIKSLLFKTTINIKNLKVQKSLKKFLPYDMKSIEIIHSILNPLVIDIKLSKQFKINNKEIMKYLTKTQTGYRYEYKF
jgi:hypothetical protein